MKEAIREALAKMYMARDGQYGKIGRAIIIGGIVFDAAIVVFFTMWILL